MRKFLIWNLIILLVSCCGCDNQSKKTYVYGYVECEYCGKTLDSVKEEHNICDDCKLAMNITTAFFEQIPEDMEDVKSSLDDVLLEKGKGE